MYLSHFGLTSAPFALTPNTQFFHALPPHLEAITTTLAALEMGEGIIQISGEVGTGKTLVCRMIINQLPAHFELAYLPTPAACGNELRMALAKELNIDSTGDTATLTERLHQALLERKAKRKSVVLILDEAQALSDEVLEVIRLLGNLETEHEKLLHIILLGQPELDQRLAQHHMRQFRQRITFRSCLRELELAEAVAYIEHRLNSVSKQEYQSLFSLAQYKEIWTASYGIPRLINQLCHKALIAACSDNRLKVSRHDVLLAIKDTLGARQPRWTYPVLWGWH
ncbi:ExeA family protein [Photobacterium minamisatsumaniensis]|uniref:ExeA family protein n=1 Tax=Photobacterium minamisatsumaniensis TaxID=2910233 RepID=UPI003D0A379B